MPPAAHVQPDPPGAVSPPEDATCDGQPRGPAGERFTPGPAPALLGARGVSSRRPVRPACHPGPCTHGAVLQPGSAPPGEGVPAATGAPSALSRAGPTGSAGTDPARTAATRRYGPPEGLPGGTRATRAPSPGPRPVRPRLRRAGAPAVTRERSQEVPQQAAGLAPRRLTGAPPATGIQGRYAGLRRTLDPGRSRRTDKPAGGPGMGVAPDSRGAGSQRQ